MMSYAQLITQAAEHLKPQVGSDIKTAVLLGTGLSELAELETDTLESPIDYADIPGMVDPGVTTHKGHMVKLNIDQQNVLFCQGRLHLYEGHSAQQVAFLVYVLRNLGVENLIITNAAGALNPDYRPGDVMVIEDHINHTGHNPVRGQQDELGQRFTDMSQAYPSSTAAQAMRIGCDAGLPMHLGVYAGVLGPTLETSAERRMLRNWGADAVGMSTVMESIAANHCGMQVLGLSAISNMAIGDSNQQVDTIEDVLKNASVAAVAIRQIIWTLLKT